MGTAFTYIPLFSSFHSNLKSTVKSPFKVRTYNSIQEYTSYTTQPPKCLPNLRSSSSSLPTTRWATQESPLDGTCPNSPTHTTFSHHTPKSASPLPPAAPHPSIPPQSKLRRRTKISGSRQRSWTASSDGRESLTRFSLWVDMAQCLTLQLLPHLISSSTSLHLRTRSFRRSATVLQHSLMSRRLLAPTSLTVMP